jgi:DNA-binding transcriptional ArsR family regulator
VVVDDLSDDAVDELFRALADPTRPDILRGCAGREPSVSGLARAYP